MLESKAEKFSYRPLFGILLLALMIHLVAWNLINVITPFSIELIMYGAKANTPAFLKDLYQEPFHPAVLYLVHKVLFPHEFIGDVLNSSSWELTSFFVGLFFTGICLWLLFEIGRYLHSPAAGLWAAFFLAVGFYAINYSVMGLSEIPYLALILLTIYLTLRSSAVRDIFLLLAGACAILSLMTRKEGILTLGIIPLYLLVQQNVALLRRLKRIGLFLIGVGIVGGGFWALGGRFAWLVPYMPPVLQSQMKFLTLNSDLNSWLILADTSISQPRDFFTFSFNFVLLGWIKMSGVLPALLCFVFIFKRQRFPTQPGTALLFLYLICHFTLLYANYYRHGSVDNRYLFPPAVIIFPMAGIVLAELLKRRTVLAGVVGVMLITIYIPVDIHSFIRNRRPEIAAAVRWISDNTPSESFILTQDSRIGFYCRRPWDNFYYTAVNTIGTTNPKPQRNPLLLALLYKKTTGPDLPYWLKYLNLNQTMKAEKINVFTGSKNEVGLFKLSPIIPTSK